VKTYRGKTLPEARVSNRQRFRVRPGYQSSDLLLEVVGDHRRPGFPNVASLLSASLNARRQPHPEGLDHIDPVLHDRFITYWSFPDGSYEIDDDLWGLFVTARENNEGVIARVEGALVATGLFEKEEVDFAQYR
jgi:hypothetical protein